uniref:Uncharacterized protein n=1 Tax=Prolemur simus TaxID=1328070 RepID=A0A8C8YMA8_PROSS
MDGTETRRRRPDSYGRLGELGLPRRPLGTAGLPAASEGRSPRVPESQTVAPSPLETKLSKETAVSIGLQVAVPFLLAGLGLSWAGVLLNYFQVRGDQMGTREVGSVRCPLKKRQLRVRPSLVDMGGPPQMPLLVVCWGKILVVTGDSDST